MTTRPIRIEFVPAEATFALRNEMLRPGLPVETVHFDGDHEPGTRHLAAFESGELEDGGFGDGRLGGGDGARAIASRADGKIIGKVLGVVTLLERAPPTDLAAEVPRGARVWQLRGMATAPAVRGRGLGLELVRACLAHVRETAGQGYIWCNARTSALSFYARFGFVPRGAQFEIPHGGPHFKMIARVRPVLRVESVPGHFAVARLAADAPLPPWLPARGLVSVTRTADELSVVCEASAIPIATGTGPSGDSVNSADINIQRDWAALRVSGNLDFSLTGILESLTEPLARAGISVFAVSTYDTDYLLVPAAQLSDARAAWQLAGHSV